MISVESIPTWLRIPFRTRHSAQQQGLESVRSSDYCMLHSPSVITVSAMED